MHLFNRPDSAADLRRTAGRPDNFVDDGRVLAVIEHSSRDQPRAATLPLVPLDRGQLAQDRGHK